MSGAKSPVFIARAAAVLVLLGGLAGVGTGAGICAATEQLRPPSDLPTVPARAPISVAEPVETEPTKVPPPAMLDQAQHHVPAHIEAPTKPTPKPVPPDFRYLKPVVIHVLRQDWNPLADGIETDIEKTGGRVTNKTHGVNVRRIEATVPASYLGRIEPLLRRTEEHINPHYRDWVFENVSQPATPAIDEETVALRIDVVGRFHPSPERRRALGVIFTSSTIGFLIGVPVVISLAIKGGRRVRIFRAHIFATPDPEEPTYRRRPLR